MSQPCMTMANIHPMEMKHSENLVSVTLLLRGSSTREDGQELVFMLALKPNQVEVHQHISEAHMVLMQQSSVVQGVIVKVSRNSSSLLENLIGGEEDGL